MAFDHRQLAAFLAIVRHGSLGRAADALHITQPALSRTIKRLEEQVGAPLFERHSRGMLLTPVGAGLLPHADLIQRESEHALEEINALRGLAKGTIRVGSIASVASQVLPLAVDRVLTRWPNLKVHIIEGVWDRLEEALIKHEIDIALGVATEDGDEVCSIPDCIWNDTSYVVAAADHPLRKKRRLTLADTRDCRWATMPPGTAPYDEMVRLFRAHGLGLPNVVVQTRSTTVLKTLVARAGFLGWMPEPMIEVERRASLLDTLPVEGVAVPRRLTAFRRRAGILPTPAVKLLDELRQIAAGAAGSVRKKAGTKLAAKR